MEKKQSKNGRNRNKLTTNKQVTDMALTLWECSDHITKTVMRTHLNSYFRDRLARLAQRLQKEAISLGVDLVPANEKAFESTHSAKLIAGQLGLMD
jgi:cyanophycinase-like exopeptidase